MLDLRLSRVTALAVLATAPAVISVHACAAQPTSQPVPTPESDDPHAGFDRLLAAVVRDERVDYVAVATEHRQALAQSLQSMAAVEPAGLDADARLAFYINLYNATMIEAVVERLSATYSPADDDFAVFDAPLVRLAGERVSLNHLEHEIIRKRFDEPRIHVALVCGARSCPPLLPRAYRGDDLATVLAAKMRSFVTGGWRNQIDDDARVLRLSKIFEWYAEDFGGPDGVAAYVAGVAGRPELARYSVRYVEYSWQLNAAPPRLGGWRVVQAAARLADTRGGEAAGPALAAGALVQAVREDSGWFEVRALRGERSGWLLAAALAEYRPAGR